MKIQDIIKFAASFPTNPVDQREASSHHLLTTPDVRDLSQMSPEDMNIALQGVAADIEFTNDDGETITVQTNEFEALYTALVKLCPGAKLAKDAVTAKRNELRTEAFAVRREAVEAEKAADKAKREADRAEREAATAKAKAEREAEKAKREAGKAAEKARREEAKQAAAAKAAKEAEAKEKVRTEAAKKAKQDAEKAAKAAKKK